MKQLLTLILILVSMQLFSQKKGCTKCLEIKMSDTLVVDQSQYKYIKIGDKVYKINTELVEVKKESGTILSPSWWGGNTLQIDTSGVINHDTFYIPFNVEKTYLNQRSKYPN